jgi:hypothetical protein
MKRDALDKCLRLISWWRVNDREIINDLVNNETELIDDFAEPFKRELAEMLLTKPSSAEKKDLITFYIFEISRNANIIEDYNNIEFDFLGKFSEFPKRYISHSHKNERLVTAEVRSHYLYSLMFVHLQFYCKTFDIPFSDICRAKSVSLNSFQILRSPLTPTYEEAIDKIKNSENQFLKGLLMKVVVDHFKIMTTQKSINGEVFLTEGQFLSFLRRGFLRENVIPAQHINCAGGEKGYVIKRFFEFYDFVSNNYNCPRSKEEFIDLFCDCFDNWDRQTVKALFRRDRVKKEW